MRTYSYNVGELRSIIKESSNEFKAVLGPNVEKDNKKNNSQSYKESEKRANDYNGGVNSKKKDSKLNDKEDYNRTTLDYTPVTEPDKAYKERVHAQAQGYTSKLEKDNKIEKAGAEFDTDSNLYNQFTSQTKKIADEKEKLAASGLAARTFDKSVFKKNKLSEGMKAKKLTFKNTVFLNESQVLKRIPDEYKKNGQNIIMEDKNHNEYFINCELNGAGLMETNIVGKRNKKALNEEVSRMFDLFNYDSKKQKSERNYHTMMNEGRVFNDIMDYSRNKM